MHLYIFHSVNRYIFNVIDDDRDVFAGGVQIDAADNIDYRVFLHIRS